MHMNNNFESILVNLIKSKDSSKIIKKFHKALTISDKLSSYEELSRLIKVIISYFCDSPLGTQIISKKNLKDYFVSPAFIINADKTNMTSVIMATIYSTIISLSIKSMNLILPPVYINLVSRTSKTKEGQPVNISSFYRWALNITREFFIRQSLRNSDPTFVNLNDHYVFNALANIENYFDFHPESKKIDLVMPAEYFTKFYFLFQEHILFWDEVILAPNNSRAYSFLDKKATQIKKLNFDLNNIIVSHDNLRKIAILAEEIAHYFDEAILRTNDGVYNVSTPSPLPNPGRLMLNRNLMNNFNLENMAQASFLVSRNINGRPVIFEYKPAEVYDDADYNRRSSYLKKYINKFINEITRIYASSQVINYEIDNTGSKIDAINYYRGEADTKIFENTIKREELLSKFYFMIVIDNSCSINDNKKNKMADILTLIMNTIMNHKDHFAHVTAFAQHSSGNKKVTLHKLIDEQVFKIKNPSSILHLTSNGVNYDSLAFYEIATTHAKEFNKPGITPVLLGIGDSWPVTHSNPEGVLAEQAEMIQLLKNKFPKMILMYIALDKMHQPEALSYDYFIDAKTDDALNNIISQFSQMITKIVKGF